MCAAPGIFLKAIWAVLWTLQPENIQAISAYRKHNAGQAKQRLRSTVKDCRNRCCCVYIFVKLKCSLLFFVLNLNTVEKTSRAELSQLKTCHSC